MIQIITKHANEPIQEDEKLHSTSQKAIYSDIFPPSQAYQFHSPKKRVNPQCNRNRGLSRSVVIAVKPKQNRISFNFSCFQEWRFRGKRYNNKNSTYTPNPFNLNTAVDEQVNGSNLATQYSYDIMQRLTTIGYSNNQTVDYTYNTLGQIERIPGIINESMSFDANGLLTGYQMTNGFASAFTYDNKRRVTSINHNGANNQPGQSYQFTYDKVDNIIEKSGEYFSYDRKGQMMSAVLTGEAAIEEYPLKSEEFSLGSVRSDIRGDEEVLIPSDTLTLDWGAGSLGINLGYAYKIKTIIIKPLDKTARIEKRKLQILTSLYNHEDTFKDQSFSMEQNDEDGTVTITLETGVFTRFVKIHSHINPLNSEGQPIPGGNFELDPESVKVFALTGGKNEFYAYAPDGDRQQLTVLSNNMKTDSYGYYANSDLVKTVGNFAYRYDENGNLVEKGDTFTQEGDEITIQPEGDYYLYEYDLLNRLVSVSKPGENGGLEIAVSYRYNHNNLRVKRTDSEGTTRYVYDLDGNVLEEHKGDELIRYAYRKGKHLAKFTPNETYFYGTDHLGSTTVMTDSKGEVVWRGYISPFGDSATGEGSIQEAVKFTGKELDPETGLYYFNARWYDPVLGRFTTEDPARDGVNWFVYVGHNPLRFIDPTGLETEDGAKTLINQKGFFPTIDKVETGAGSLVDNALAGLASVGNIPTSLANTALQVAGNVSGIAYSVVDRVAEAGFGMTGEDLLTVAGVGSMVLAPEIGLAKLSTGAMAQDLKGRIASGGTRLKKAGGVGKGIDDFLEVGHTPKASELKKIAEQREWKPLQTPNGPVNGQDNCPLFLMKLIASTVSSYPVYSCDLIG